MKGHLLPNRWTSGARRELYARLSFGMSKGGSVAIWDLACLINHPGVGNAIWRLQVPGGAEPQEVEYPTPSFGEGAASLMSDGYEPFSVTWKESEGLTQFWFRREVTQP